MKIKMIRTEKGSPDGISVHVFQQNNIYTVGENITQQLADIFVGMESANIIVEEVPKEPKAAKQDDKKIKAHMKPKEDK